MLEFHREGTTGFKEWTQTQLPESRIIGVIINKKIPTDKGEIRLGGPVGLTKDPNTTINVVLHNMPNEPNSKEVLPGVYWTSESKQKMEKFKKKNKLKNTKIYEYYGFASWFEG